MTSKKQFLMHGKQVDVEDFDIPNNDGVPSKMVRATLPGITVEAALTTGAVDGARPLLSVVQLQKDLDDLRQRVAEEAAWRKVREEMLQQVQ